MDRNVMIERLEWLATAKRAAQADWLPDNDWQRGITEVAAAALDEIKELDQLFDLRHAADMRAIARWRDAAPGRELKQPDHTDLVVWLLEQREDQIKAMVDRFLMWRLPETFNPDNGISFTRYEYPAAGRDRVREPVGTNLLTAVEATAMVRHMVEGMLHRPAYPDDIKSKTLLAAHYRSALDTLAQVSGELVSMRHWKAEHIADWRPIAEAPIPGPSEAPEGFIFNCLLQNARGIVGEGCARYVTDNRVRGRKHVRVLRWYMGDGIRDSRVCHDPRYFQPLPQPRKDISL